MTQIRVALVGTGGWGNQHARILSSREDIDFCAIVGRNPEKTRLRAAQYDANPYVSIDEMLATEHPALVCVCLPNQEHFETTLKLIRAGIPLLVEKPLVFERDQADTLIKEAQLRGLFFAINFNHRYAHPMQMARQALQAGRLGEIIFATWRFGGEGSSDHPFANLIETQCHGFDSLEFLCGPIQSIMAEMTDKTESGFRTLALALRFANGAVGSLLGTYDSSYAYRDTQRLEINGTKGRVLIEDTVRRYSFQPTGSETAEVWEAGYFNDIDREFHRTFDKHFDAVIAAFAASKPPPVPATAGARALELALASIESFNTGRRVQVDPQRLL